MEYTEKERDTLGYVNSAYIEARSAWAEFFIEADEDYRFYLGDQWSENDKAAALKKKIPALNLNYIKKAIDVISGYERQNRSDIKVLPVEGGDEMVAEVYSRIIKWITSDRNSEYTISAAFKDALICGIGWLTPEISYDKDILNGDILIHKESPFNILMDPHTTRYDLSDCNYVIRHKRVYKDQLKSLYPKYADEIGNLKGAVDNDGFRKDIVVPNDRGEKLNVVECWWRKYENQKFMLDTLDVNSLAEYAGTATEQKEIELQNPNVIFITRKVPKIYLTIIIEEKVMVFDGLNPFEYKDFPFIPLMTYFESSYDDWDIKLQGVVRCMKDAQREKNKRRSQIMHIINTNAQSGWLLDKGAVDDLNALRNSGGAGKVIEKNPGKQLTRIEPPNFPAAIMQLEMAFGEDIKLIGPNPDMLGMRETSDPGIAIQLRQKQGITAMQEVFDMMSFAKRRLGNIIINFINKNFSDEKIQRVLGNEVILPEEFEEMRKGVRYDCVVDETVNSPTYRLAALQALLQFQQYGGQVDPQSILDLADIPKTMKEQMLQRMQEAQQAAMQAQMGTTPAPPVTGMPPEEISPEGMPPEEMPQ